MRKVLKLIKRFRNVLVSGSIVGVLVILFTLVITPSISGIDVGIISISVGHLENDCPASISQSYPISETTNIFVSPAIIIRDGDTLFVQNGRDIIELKAGEIIYHRYTGTGYNIAHTGTPTGLSTIDVQNGIITTPYGLETVKVTFQEPDGNFLDGRAEFNLILNEQPTPDINGEYWQTLNFNVSGFNLQRILGLDEEYNQARCIEEWGQDYGNGTYSITATAIRSPDGATVLKSRAEEEVHSIVGIAIETNRDKLIMGINPDNGGNITYTKLSRDYLNVLRRLLIDKNGKTARIEDIIVVSNQIKFKLPKAFIEAGSTKYPVAHATGTDPAYTQKMASYSNTGGSDNSWIATNCNTAWGIPNDSTLRVLEIIMENIAAGTENLTGVRKWGTFLERSVDIHEAEGGACTHARMFTQTSWSGSAQLVEIYGEDMTDAVWYCVGYWENVTFTELIDLAAASGASSWVDQTLTAGASVVHHIMMENFEADVANTMGVRKNGSSVERKLLVHEPESGGEVALDMLIKSDASKVIEVYTTDTLWAKFGDYGYFGSELDHVETWQYQSNVGYGTWTDWDISAYLDQDGRMADFLCVNTYETGNTPLGVKDGDDTTTSRYLNEHEAESSGSGGEWTGFGMSAKSNSSGVIHYWDSILAADKTRHYMTGYMKPSSSCTPSISNTPSSKALGTVKKQTSVWSSGSAPTYPIDDAECFFAVTNNGACTVNINAHGHDFTGGNTYTLVTGTPASAEIRIKLGRSGDANEGAMLTLSKSDQSFYTGLGIGAHLHWEFMLTTGTYTDATAKSSDITLTSVVG